MYLLVLLNQAKSNAHSKRKKAPNWVLFLIQLLIFFKRPEHSSHKTTEKFW
ncbi:hypothetical protein GNK04_10115 [Bacillus sp. N1-1]|nr:hypothetical protein GNK04_10115 [Bacillus sp. N1-1]